MIQHSLWLKFHQRISTLKQNRLLEYFGSSEGVYKAGKDEYEACGFLTQREAAMLCNKDMWEAEAELQLCEALGFAVIDIESPYYPPLLKAIADPPVALYVEGPLENLLSPCCITMVGSRICSQTGAENAMKIAADLAQNGLTVVSGFAVGIDAASHQGALNVGGKTIGVYATGLDVLYPQENERLRMRFQQSDNTIISEFPLGRTVKKYTFQIRNRILSGMSRGVIVPEAGLRSGSLITTSYATEQGREVYTVPGAINNGCAAGSNRLIQDGATVILSTNNVTETFFKHYVRDNRIEPVPDRAVPPPAPSAPQKQKEKEPDDPLLAHIQASPVTFDELLAKSGLGVQEIKAKLTLLELSGYISKLAGEQYIRKGRM